MCDDSNNPGLGEFLQGFSPTLFDYNIVMKGSIRGAQNTLPLRAMRVKGFDVSNNI